MKKILSIFLFLSLTFAANAQQERILSFHSDILVDTTAIITVTETIEVYAGGDNIKRGIYRTLPMTRIKNTGKEKVRYEVVSVTQNGVSAAFHTKTQDGSFYLYIGEENRILSPGVYTYEITYTANGQIGYFDTFDELYWNVTGNYWEMPIDRVSATVHLPENAAILQHACYTGEQGSSAADCSVTQTDERTLTWNAANLPSGEGLTIAAGFQKGSVYQPPPPPPPGFLERYGILITAIVFLLIMLVYYVVTWQKYGIDPPKPTVYPQFDVPENLSPASMGLLHKERYNNNLATASIVNLAVKGYVHITQTENQALFGLVKSKTFTLLKLRNPDSALPTEEKQLMEKLFKGQPTAIISGSYDEDIGDAMNAFRKNINAQHRTVIKEGQNYKFLVFPIILFILFLIIAAIFTMRNGEEDILPVIFGGLFMLPFIIIMVTAFKSFSFNNLKSIRWLFPIVFFIVFSMSGSLFSIVFKPNLTLDLYAIGGFFVLSLILIGVYQYLIKRPSEEKLRIQSLIDGFKMYLGAAEEKPLQYFNPPAVTPEVFEKLLPYAMVLGVDKIWGEKFQQMLNSSAINNDEYRTTWYSGSPMNVALLTSTLGSSMNSSLSSASTPPSSSGSSGSGSSGGGFSGGGGGGGGGGGW